MKKGLIIYDFDGVLVDSRASVTIYYKALLRHLNQPMPDWDDPQVRSDIFGMSHIQMLNKYAPNLSDEMFQEAIHYSPPILDEIMENTFLEKGVSEILPILAKNNHIAICTNRGESVSHYLKRFGIDSYFSYIVCSLDVSEGKPSPEGINKILSHFNVSNALYVGDSDVDYLAAKAAGVNFLSFRSKLFDSIVINEHHEILDHLI